MRIRHLIVGAVLALALGVPATAAADFQHVVAPGESLSSVAAADGLSVSQLATANGLSPDAQLTAGATLAIPPQDGTMSSSAPAQDTGTSASSETSSGETTSSASSAGGYTVEPGDTLSAIAQRYGTTVSALAAENGLSPSGILPAGATLQVSGAGTASTSSSSSYDGSSGPSAASESGAGSEPTAQTVTPGDVATIASEQGVSPSLADAIAQQESGFNNDEVSKTGATGVMQIEPGTWRDIQQQNGSSLSSSSATDNIRGGVSWLHSLLDQTGGDTSEAIAAYYQGLQSVQQHGEYADTQRYVDNVLALQQRYGGG